MHIEVKSSYQPKGEAGYISDEYQGCTFLPILPHHGGLSLATIQDQSLISSATIRKPDTSNSHQSVSNTPVSSLAQVLLCQFDSFVSIIHPKQHRQVNSLSSKRGGHI